MSKCKNSVFVAALLYSNAKLDNKFEQDLLTCVLSIIRRDEILSQTLHTVCIDNKYSRDILRYNKTETKVYCWPVFALRYPGEEKPIIYSLSSANKVFEEVYDAYKKFRLCQGRTVPSAKPPDIDCCEKPKHKEITVEWNLCNFPPDGSGETIYLNKDDLILFKSTDELIYDLVQTDCHWRILPDPEIDYRKCCRVCFEETVLFDETGTFYFICSLYPDRMRLKVVVDCKSAKPCKKQTITKNYQYVREFPHKCGKGRTNDPLSGISS